MVQWNLSFGASPSGETKVGPETEKCSYNLCISYLHWRDASIQGTLFLVSWVSPEWRFHCIRLALSVINRRQSQNLRQTWDPLSVRRLGLLTIAIGFFFSYNSRSTHMSSQKTGKWKCAMHTPENSKGIIMAESHHDFLVEGLNSMLLAIKTVNERKHLSGCERHFCHWT